MNTLIIKKYLNGTIEIKSDLCKDERKYIFYSEKDAIKDYRRRNNLVGKHLQRIHILI